MGLQVRIYKPYSDGQIMFCFSFVLRLWINILTPLIDRPLIFLTPTSHLGKGILKKI